MSAPTAMAPGKLTRLAALTPAPVVGTLEPAVAEVEREVEIVLLREDDVPVVLPDDEVPVELVVMVIVLEPVVEAAVVALALWLPAAPWVPVPPDTVNIGE